MRGESRDPAGISWDAAAIAVGDTRKAGIHHTPTTGASTGFAPNTDPATSSSAAMMSPTMLTGPARNRESNDAGPSVNGHWATTAARSWSSRAIRSTWPPPNEVPHTAIRSGSTSGRDRP